MSKGVEPMRGEEEKEQKEEKQRRERRENVRTMRCQLDNNVPTQPYIYGRPAQQMQTFYFTAVTSSLWPPNRACHYILPLWFFLLSFFCPSLFFLAYSQRSQTGCLPYTSTYDVALVSANLECMPEMCCTRLTETQDAKIAKIRHIRTIAQLFRAVSRNYGMYRQSENKLSNSNISSTCPNNMVNFSPLTAEIGWRVWVTQQSSTGFTYWLR